MTVTVVTNVELGWDCVVGVYLDEKYARSLHIGEQYVFTTNKRVEETIFKEEEGTLKKFREKKDFVFVDGCLAGEESMKKDKNYALKLQKSISTFKTDLDIQVVLETKYDYYVIAIRNPPKGFDLYSDETESLYDELTKHYEKDGLVFQ